MDLVLLPKGKNEGHGAVGVSLIFRGCLIINNFLLTRYASNSHHSSALQYLQIKVKRHKNLEEYWLNQLKYLFQ